MAEDVAVAVAVARTVAGQDSAWDATKPVFSAVCYQESIEVTLFFTYHTTACQSADNISCNKLVAANCGQPVVGCYPHYLHLAVSFYIDQCTD